MDTVLSLCPISVAYTEIDSGKCEKIYDGDKTLVYDKLAATVAC